jgi:hypothetical protein
MELSSFPSTIFSSILLKGIHYQNTGRLELARVRVMNHNSEYHLIEKYKLLENFQPYQNPGRFELARVRGMIPYLGIPSNRKI